MGSVEYDARRALAARPVTFGVRSGVAARYLEASIYEGMRRPPGSAELNPPVVVPARPDGPIAGPVTDQDAEQVVAAVLGEQAPVDSGDVRTRTGKARWWSGPVLRWRRSTPGAS